MMTAFADFLTMSPFRLLDLLPELQAWIVESVAVDDLLNYSLACKELYNQSKRHLALHKGYHSLHRVKHDRVPSSIPKLLRQAVSEPEKTWHVRTLDFWGARKVVEDWKTWPFPDGCNPTRDDQNNVDPNWPDDYEDFTEHIQRFFDERELVRLGELMIDTQKLTPEMGAAALVPLREGMDMPMKILLLALLPRVEHVNFIGFDRFESLGALHLFCLSILCIHQSYLKVWPPGFSSLRRIDVATRTTLRGSMGILSQTNCTPSQVAILFLLPNLKVLNLDGVTEETALSDIEFEYYGLSSTLRAGSSSVEELGLYDCGISGPYLYRFLWAPARLTKLTMRACSQLRQPSVGNTSVLMRAKENTLLGDVLVDHQADSLLELRSRSVELKILKKFKNLVLCDYLWIDQTILEMSPAGESDQETGNQDAQSKQLEVPDLRNFLPYTIETVRIRLGRPWTLGRQLLEQVLTMLADLGDDTWFPSLEEVCIYSIMDAVLELLDVESPDGAYCQAVSRLTKRGVELHNERPVEGTDDHETLHEAFQGSGFIESDPNRCSHPRW